MKFIKAKLKRKSLRIKGYDYNQNGYYFITICTNNRNHLFGSIENGKMVLNDYGEILEKIWLDLPKHNNNIELDYHCIMPNHFHCIIILNDKKNTNSESPTGKHPLSEIIRQLKTFSSKRINELRRMTGYKIWQRDYFDHIIRNEAELYEIRTYIDYNPLKWEEDEYNK